MGEAIGGIMGGGGGGSSAAGSAGSIMGNAAQMSMAQKAAEDAAKGATVSGQAGLQDAYGGVSTGTPDAMKEQYLAAGEDEARKRKQEEMISALGTKDPTAPARTYFS